MQYELGFYLHNRNISGYLQESLSWESGQQQKEMIEAFGVVFCLHKYTPTAWSGLPLMDHGAAKTGLQNPTYIAVAKQPLPGISSSSHCPSWHEMPTAGREMADFVPGADKFS